MKFLVTNRRKPSVKWVAWGLSVLILACVVGVVTLPPWVDLPLRLAIMQALDPFCHQIAERSPHVDGVPLAVCHRCFGVYVGLFLGPWMMLATRSWHSNAPGLIIGLSLVPLSVDWGLEVIGWVSNTPISRVMTGGLFGVVAGVLVARGVALKASVVVDVPQEEAASSADT